MIELEIYNRELEVLGVVTEWYSLRWLRKYNNIGEFELHCRINSNNLEIIRTGNLITRYDAEEIGVIENIKIEDNPENGAKFILTGRFLEGITEERLLMKKQNFTGKISSNISKLISENLINVESARKYNLLKIGSIYDTTETADFQMGLGKNIGMQIQKLCKIANVGFKIVADYDNKAFEFILYKGRDLRNMVILSDADGNIKNSEYEKNTSPLKTFAIVAGAGEGEKRKNITLDDGSTGWNRKEVFIDARDIEDKKTVNDEEVEIPLSEYNQLLATRGQEKMEEHKVYENFQSEVVITENDVYKQDWDLGDIVTVYSEKWDKEITERVVEVEEIFENGIINIYPTFGSPLPLLTDILKEEEIY